MIRALLREAALRLPGVYFLAASADDRPALPPLHESAFVGFAPYGPLDRPIPVDSAAASPRSLAAIWRSRATRTAAGSTPICVRRCSVFLPTAVAALT